MNENLQQPLREFFLSLALHVPRVPSPLFGVLQVFFFFLLSSFVICLFVCLGVPALNRTNPSSHAHTPVQSGACSSGGGGGARAREFLLVHIEQGQSPSRARHRQHTQHRADWEVRHDVIADVLECPSPGARARPFVRLFSFFFFFFLTSALVFIFARSGARATVLIYVYLS